MSQYYFNQGPGYPDASATMNTALGGLRGLVAMQNATYANRRAELDASASVMSELRRLELDNQKFMLERMDQRRKENSEAAANLLQMRRDERAQKLQDINIMKAERTFAQQEKSDSFLADPHNSYLLGLLNNTNPVVAGMANAALTIRPNSQFLPRSYADERAKALTLASTTMLTPAGGRETSADVYANLIVNGRSNRVIARGIAGLEVTGGDRGIVEQIRKDVDLTALAPLIEEEKQNLTYIDKETSEQSREFSIKAMKYDFGLKSLERARSEAAATTDPVRRKGLEDSLFDRETALMALGAELSMGAIELESKGVNIPKLLRDQAGFDTLERGGDVLARYRTDRNPNRPAERARVIADARVQELVRAAEAAPAVGEVSPDMLSAYQETAARAKAAANALLSAGSDPYDPAVRAAVESYTAAEAAFGLNYIYLTGKPLQLSAPSIYGDEFVTAANMAKEVDRHNSANPDDPRFYAPPGAGKQYYTLEEAVAEFNRAAGPGGSGDDLYLEHLAKQLAPFVSKDPAAPGVTPSTDVLAARGGPRRGLAVGTQVLQVIEKTDVPGTGFFGGVVPSSTGAAPNMLGRKGGDWKKASLAIAHAVDTKRASARIATEYTRGSGENDNVIDLLVGLNPPLERALRFDNKYAAAAASAVLGLAATLAEIPAYAGAVAGHLSTGSLVFDTPVPRPQINSATWRIAHRDRPQPDYETWGPAGLASVRVLKDASGALVYRALAGSSADPEVVFDTLDQAVSVQEAAMEHARDRGVRAPRLAARLSIEDLVDDPEFQSNAVTFIEALQNRNTPVYKALLERSGGKEDVAFAKSQFLISMLTAALSPSSTSALSAQTRQSWLGEASGARDRRREESMLDMFNNALGQSAEPPDQTVRTR